jgi:hypothetical protein
LDRTSRKLSTDFSVTTVLSASQILKQSTSSNVIKNYWNGPFQKITLFILNTWTSPAELSSDIDGQLNSLQTYHSNLDDYKKTFAKYNNDSTAVIGNTLVNLSANTELLRQLVFLITNDSQQGIIDENKANLALTLFTEISTDYDTIESEIKNITTNTLQNQYVEYLSDISCSSYYVNNNDSVNYLISLKNYYLNVNNFYQSYQVRYIRNSILNL